MRNLHNLGIPDLPLRAFQPDALGRLAGLHGGKGGSAPKTPDYEAAARATAEGNLDLAKYTTEANRINQYTPWGSLTYTNDRTFDQAGYDEAMAAYNRQSQQPAQAQDPLSSHPLLNGLMGQSSAYVNAWVPGTGDAGGYMRRVPVDSIAGAGRGGAMAPPSMDDFWSGGDNWSQHVELAPELQAQLEQQWAIQAGLVDPQNAALGRVQDMMSSGFDMSGLPEGGTALDPSLLPEMGSVYDPNLQTNNATELLMERINPQLDRQREALRAQLANQGIAQGSSAYDNAMLQHGQAANDAYTQAALTGIGLGMQQQGLQFGQQQGLRMGEAGLQGQQFGQSEQARQRAMMEAAYLRNLPLQELQMLTGGGQVQMPQFPGYAQQAQTAGPDLVGAANAQYGADLGAWNAQQAQQQQMQQGFGSMGGALGSMFGGPVGGLVGNIGGSLLGGLFSDRRLKRNIKAIGKADNGLTIYSYQYVTGGPTQLGYMADEVQKIAPDAVGEQNGYLTVDYSKV